MIQAINSTQANRNLNFGNNSPEAMVNHPKYQKPSKTKRVVSYATGQFVAGAIVSSLLNIGGNIFEKLKSVPDKTKILSGSNILKQAAVMGGIFVVIGLIIDGVFSFMYRNKNKNK